MRQVTIHDFLTSREIELAADLLAEHGDVLAVDEIQRQIIAPNMERINEALGQENDSRYLAYVTVHILITARRAG